MHTARRGAPSGTQAIQRAASILKELGRAGGRGLRIVDLCERLPIERPTLHRILTCLVAEHLVVRDERSRRYLLGEDLYRLGLVAGGRFDLRQLCSTAVTNIAMETGDTVFLAARQGHDGLVVDRRDGAVPIPRMPLHVGVPRPLGAGASGLAMLTSLPDPEITELIADNAARLLRYNLLPEKMPRLVSRTRRDGYAYCRGYGLPEICGVGLPLQNGRDICLGAVSVTALAPRMTATHRERVLAVLERELAPVRRRLRELHG
jgi:DNA-binding IclR family transcriptional regulator